MDEQPNLEDMSAKQEEAILALLSEASVPRAAQKIGIGERTLYRWLEEPTFARAFRQARRQAFGQAVALVQRYATMAANTFARVITDTSASPQAKVSAASAIMRLARQGIELDDIEARVEALELAAQNDQKKGRP